MGRIMVRYATVLRISKYLCVIVVVLGIVCLFVLPAPPPDWFFGYAIALTMLWMLFTLAGGLFALIVMICCSPFKGPGKAYPYLLLLFASAFVAFTLYKIVSSNMARAKADERLEREQSQPVETVPTK